MSEPQVTRLPPSVARLQPKLGELLTTANQVEQDFAAREASLKQGIEQLKEDERKSMEEIADRKAADQTEIGLERGKLKLEQENHQLKMSWERRKFDDEKQAYEEMKRRAAKISHSQEPISLEVGGEKFRTEISTLQKHTGSIFPQLAAAAQGGSPQRKTRSEHIFIDRDGKHFRFILNYLRQGREVMRGTALRNADDSFLEELLCEVKYYGLEELERLVRLRKVSLQKLIDFNSLVAQKCFLPLKQPTGGEGSASPQKPAALKYRTTRDLNLRERNLTGIQFEGVLFQHQVSFEGSILFRATFTSCVFKGPANFLGTELGRVLFEGCQGIDLATNFAIGNDELQSVTFNPPLPPATTP